MPQANILPSCTAAKVAVSQATKTIQEFHDIIYNKFNVWEDEIS